MNRTCKRILLSACVAALFMKVDCVKAQTTLNTDASIDQSRRFNLDPNLRPEKPASSADQGGLSEVPTTPGDDDIGIQEILSRDKPKQPSFSAFADYSPLYTSNVGLSRENAEEDWMMVAQAGVSWQKQLIPNLYGDVTFRYQMFRYQDFTELDFDSLNAGAGVTYVIQPLGGLAASARYNYNRLTDEEEYNEFFKNHTLTFGLNKTFSFSRAHYAYVGFSAEVGMSDPAASQRDEYSLYSGYNLSVTRSFDVNLFYRFGYSVYDFSDREDISNTFSLGATYKILSWLELNAVTSYSFNMSTESVFDYEVFTGGGALALKVKF